MTTEPLPRPQYKAVVFDLGNVLVGWAPYLALQDLLTPEQWEAFVVEADFYRINQRADGGEPVTDLIEELAVKNPDHSRLMAAYFERFALALTGPVPGTEEIVRELNAAGWRTLGLTNWASHTFGYAAKSAPVIDELQGIVVSGEIGITKPDARIFEYFLRYYSLTPAEVVFIDDSPGNIQAALDLGIHAIQFQDARRLRTDLRQLGLLKPRG